MIMYVFSTPGTPADRQIEQLTRELERFRVSVESIDANTPRGSSMADLYDLQGRPSAVLVRDDGSVVERWPHELPLAGDVSYLAHS